MKLMKYYLLISLCMFSGSASAFILRFIVGGLCLTGAYYEAQITQQEYEKAQKFFSARCEPITRDDVQDLEKLQKKCYCFYNKYNKAIPPGLLTVVLGGFGARCFLKGIIR